MRVADLHGWRFRVLPGRLRASHALLPPLAVLQGRRIRQRLFRGHQQHDMREDLGCHRCHGHQGTRFILSVMATMLYVSEDPPLGHHSVGRTLEAGPAQASYCVYNVAKSCPYLTSVSSHRNTCHTATRTATAPGHAAWSPLHHLLPKAIAAADSQNIASSVSCVSQCTERVPS